MRYGLINPILKSAHIKIHFKFKASLQYQQACLQKYIKVHFNNKAYFRE